MSDKLRDIKCPDCGEGFKHKPFNRHGWYTNNCGRRYHPERGWAMPGCGCLDNQLDQAKAKIGRLCEEVRAAETHSNTLDGLACRLRESQAGSKFRRILGSEIELIEAVAIELHPVKRAVYHKAQEAAT